MRIGIATDHGGFGVKEELVAVGPEVAWDLVQTYLAAEYSSAPRHLPVACQGKVAALESERRLHEQRQNYSARRQHNPHALD